jgi:epoxyqueuosine reductase
MVDGIIDQSMSTEGKVMKENSHPQYDRTIETANLISMIKNFGLDLVGIADLSLLEGIPTGIASGNTEFLNRYKYAIVMGMQVGKLGKKATGIEVDLVLEKNALETTAYLEKNGFNSLIIHTEDEIDPVNRMGLLSLKVLAKGAGLGWQGRSLLIISPEFGPIHRWIAVLTNMDLIADRSLANLCGDCSLCVDKCPFGALKLAVFDDHPDHREDVLDITICKGDAGCNVCLMVCPWIKAHV